MCLSMNENDRFLITKRYEQQRVRVSTGNSSQYLVIMENNLKCMCVCMTESLAMHLKHFVNCTSIKYTY